MKKYLLKPSAAVVIGALRRNGTYMPVPDHKNCSPIYLILLFCFCPIIMKNIINTSLLSECLIFFNDRYSSILTVSKCESLHVLRFMGTPLIFFCFFTKGVSIMTTSLLPWKKKPIQNGVHSYRKESAPRGANSFL